MPETTNENAFIVIINYVISIITLVFWKFWNKTHINLRISYLD